MLVFKQIGQLTIIVRMLYLPCHFSREDLYTKADYLFFYHALPITIRYLLEICARQGQQPGRSICSVFMHPVFIGYV